MEYCIHCMEPLQPGKTTCPACGKAQSYDCPENHLQPGTVLCGHFLLGAALGAGGFGITYIARDTQLNKVVAVKEFYPHDFVTRNSVYTRNVTATTRGRDFFERSKIKFLEEAQILASLDDQPGIVDVLAYFEENHTAYIVMKFLRGETLKARIRHGGPLPFDKAFALLRPVMRSLMALHQKNIIHRDIAPDNIMLTGGGATLFDFGAAREVASEGQSLTIILKPGYAPYEQYTKTNQGPWTDVHALCATLYFCVAGRPPMEALKRIEPGSPPLSFDGLGLSAPVQAALTKGLAVFPSQRYQSVDDLMRALDDAERTPQPVPPKPTPPRPVQPRPVQPKPEPPKPVTPAPATDPTRQGRQPTQAAPTEALKPRQPDHTRATEAVLRGAPDANTPAKADKPEGTGKHPAVKIIAIVLAVILAFGGVVWMVIKSDGNSRTTGTTDARDDIIPAAADVTVGNYITFGAYEQDNNTSNRKEPIEWLVLDVQDGKALLVSKYALDCQPYNTTYTGVTWSTCTLRTWLNNTFYNNAFSTAEQSKIQTTTVKNYGTDGGSDTYDQVFLLSIDEVNKNTYFSSDEARKCASTAYAKAQGVWTSDTYTTTGGAATCWWWLRSPGYGSYRAAHVLYGGSVSTDGYFVYISGNAVRPALWIDLES